LADLLTVTPRMAGVTEGAFQSKERDAVPVDNTDFGEIIERRDPDWEQRRRLAAVVRQLDRSRGMIGRPVVCSWL
jgi:hypothetical protein